MKARISHGFSAVILAVCFVWIAAFSSFASVDGALSEAGESVISGWAADAEHPDKSVPVVLCVYTDGSREPQELVKVTADQYRTDLTNSAANGKHAFSYKVDWDKLEGHSFMIEAYAETDEGRVRLYGSLRYTKKEAAVTVAATGSGPSGNTGPGSKETTQDTARRGALLGIFETTAYCTCKQCCPNGTALTYSGTVPKANHTISADITKYPLGTKLMIGDVVYTVEDIGSTIVGNRLDIYFSTHEEALDYGVQSVEVYAVE
ncbi:hypothetical protein D3Z50_10445 [Clostridiaceae bacterium]|nr:hypothetical protein [Clostridium sp.]NBI71475.1 hypothetical protein [Clostridiaceae bacterium]